MTMTHQDWLTQHPMRTMCGGCKATGVKHEWTKEALLAPVKPYAPCPTCHGTGWFVQQPDGGDYMDHLYNR